MENNFIHCIIKNVTYKYPPPPPNFDPARLVTITVVCYTDLIEACGMWMAIFPQKATTTVCLGFFINPSSMIYTVQHV